MFSIQVPYRAVVEIQAECPEQLSLIQDQPVRVVDSRRADWWLVTTIPEEEESGGVAEEGPKEGWVRAELLQADEGEWNEAEEVEGFVCVCVCMCIYVCMYVYVYLTIII